MSATGELGGEYAVPPSPSFDEVLASFTALAESKSKLVLPAPLPTKRVAQDNISGIFKQKKIAKLAGEDEIKEALKLGGEDEIKEALKLRGEDAIKEALKLGGEDEIKEALKLGGEDEIKEALKLEEKMLLRRRSSSERNIE